MRTAAACVGAIAPIFRPRALRLRQISVPLAIRQHAPLLQRHAPRETPLRRAQFSSHGPLRVKHVTFLRSNRPPSPRVRGEGRDEGALPLGAAVTSPHPDCFAIRPLPDAGEVKETRSTQTAQLVLAALSCARALPTATDAKKICFPSSKREAERRKAHANHVRVFGRISVRELALLWQIYSRCVLAQIRFRQCGHRCGGGRAMSATMA